MISCTEVKANSEGPNQVVFLRVKGHTCELAGNFCGGLLLVGRLTVLWYFDRKKRRPEGFEDGEGKLTLGDQVREFLQNLRYFRIFIALWNIVIIFCMFM